jgi:hypothetical protein
VKDAFAKKFFGAGRASAGGALASVLRKHSSEGRTPDAVERCVRHCAALALGTGTCPTDSERRRQLRRSRGAILAAESTRLFFGKPDLGLTDDCELDIFHSSLAGSGPDAIRSTKPSRVSRRGCSSLGSTPLGGRTDLSPPAILGMSFESKQKGLRVMPKKALHSSGWFRSIFELRRNIERSFNTSGYCAKFLLTFADK